jgi:hypothetical protein
VLWCVLGVIGLFGIIYEIIGITNTVYKPIDRDEIIATVTAGVDEIIKDEPYKIEYVFEFDDDSQAYIYNTWAEELTAIAAFTMIGNEDFQAEWEVLHEGFAQSSRKFKSVIDAAGDTKVAVIYTVFSDESRNRTLLSAYNGEITYDIVKDSKENNLNVQAIFSRNEIVTILVSCLNIEYDYSFEFNNDAQAYIFNAWGEGIKDTANLAALEDEDAQTEWEWIYDDLLRWGKTLAADVKSFGDTESAVIVNVLNETNQDNILLTIYNGEVTYDVVENYLKENAA